VPVTSPSTSEPAVDGQGRPPRDWLDPAFWQRAGCRAAAIQYRV